MYLTYVRMPTARPTAHPFRSTNSSVRIEHIFSCFAALPTRIFRIVLRFRIDCVDYYLHPSLEEGGGSKETPGLSSHSPVPAPVHTQVNYRSTWRNSAFVGLQLTTVGDLVHVCMYSSLFPRPSSSLCVSHIDALTLGAFFTGYHFPT